MFLVLFAVGRVHSCTVEMSLISQNAVIKDNAKKKNKKSKRVDNEDEESSLLEGVEEVIEKEDSDIEASVTYKKKKKRSDTEVKKMLLEEEMEMQKLGNFLFGSLHSPVEFGKEHDEEGLGGVVLDDSELFIMDRSGNDTMSVYEDNSGYHVENMDEDGDKQRKPVWLDDEEEETTVDISKVNRLRKLRKEEDETVISGSAYVSRSRAHHAKLYPGTDWANFDSKIKRYDSDDEFEVENGSVVASGYKNVDDILKTNEELVVKK